VVTLGSYLDAGHAQNLVDQHLLNNLEHHRLGTFDADQVFDYTGHRPHVIFDHDHFADFQTPEILLYRLHDRQGSDFLLLTGPEPSLQWERMTAAIEHVIVQFGVERTILMHGFPAPAPHTRPVLVTQFASDPALIAIHSGLPASFEMSSSFDALLTIRLGEKKHQVIGLSAHVPHYLTSFDYPDAAIALLQTLTEVTSLDLPLDELTTAANSTLEQINAQVEDNSDLQAVIEAMERHYDAMVKERGQPIKPEDLPTADEIGAELENYLRELASHGQSASERGTTKPLIQLDPPKRAARPQPSDDTPTERPTRASD